MISTLPSFSEPVINTALLCFFSKCRYSLPGWRSLSVQITVAQGLTRSSMAALWWALWWGFFNTSQRSSPGYFFSTSRSLPSEVSPVNRNVRAP